MKVIIVKEEDTSPCAYRTSEQNDVINRVIQAMAYFNEIEISYEDMTEEQFGALREFEAA